MIEQDRQIDWLAESGKAAAWPGCSSTPGRPTHCHRGWSRCRRPARGGHVGTDSSSTSAKGLVTFRGRRRRLCPEQQFVQGNTSSLTGTSIFAVVDHNQWQRSPPQRKSWIRVTRSPPRPCLSITACRPETPRSKGDSAGKRPRARAARADRRDRLGLAPRHPTLSVRRRQILDGQHLAVWPYHALGSLLGDIRHSYVRHQRFSDPLPRGTCT